MIFGRQATHSRIARVALGRSMAAIFAVACVTSPGVRAATSTDPYGPYEFLIGEWDVGPSQGGPRIATARFRWGPNRAYIWYAGGFMVNGVERPHFEGLLIWNGASKRLDMLLSMDLDHGLVQEQGTVSIRPDDTVVRDVTATYSEGVRPIGQPVAGPGGATARFRQTFKASGPDKILTMVMRQADQGWVATFPGSDDLVMTRHRGPS